MSPRIPVTFLLNLSASGNKPNLPENNIKREVKKDPRIPNIVKILFIDSGNMYRYTRFRQRNQKMLAHHTNLNLNTSQLLYHKAYRYLFETTHRRQGCL